MTFEEQVEGITSLTITSTSSPTQDELSQFLKDGAMEVKNRHLINKPNDVHLFSKESGESAINGLNINGSQIINVVREAGVDNDWRNCRFISPSLQSRVTDPNSFNFASAFNPAYTILGDNDIHVFPEPNASSNTYKVYHVNTDPSIVDYSFDSIDHFPASKTYLVVIYAAIQSICNYMTNLNTLLPSNSGGPPSSTSSGWAYVDYLIKQSEDIELATANVSSLNAEIQSVMTEYKWYADRMQNLKVQYDEAFKLEMPKPSQEG